jgi:hypothetical protein
VEGDETVIKLKKQALGCELQHSNLRILSWKMFLGLLSTPPRAEEWIKELNQQREQFNKLSQKYKQLSLDEIEDPNINNPLSLDITSPWSVFFEDEKLKKMIIQDIDRTYPEYTYFKQQWVKDMMLDILFIYSKENPEISYRQGMHELLAPVIYMLDQEKIPPSEKSILSKIMDSKFIHHDAYIIFERLMKTTGIWFISKLSKKLGSTPQLRALAGLARPSQRGRRGFQRGEAMPERALLHDAGRLNELSGQVGFELVAL